MIRVLTGLFLLGCLLSLGESAKKVKLVDKAAEIAVSVMSENTSNTTYIFGVFGRNSLTGPVSGQLVHVRSEGGINHGCSEYIHDVPGHDWVALIERGTCYFHTKINMAAKQYNATAVIVYDNKPSTELVMMQSRVRDEVYVFVTQAYGRRLALLADSGLNVHVNISAAAVSASASTSVFLSTPSFTLYSLLTSVYLLLLCHTL